jgi:hypothetical protein
MSGNMIQFCHGQRRKDRPGYIAKLKQSVRKLRDVTILEKLFLFTLRFSQLPGGNFNKCHVREIPFSPKNWEASFHTLCKKNAAPESLDIICDKWEL